MSDFVQIAPNSYVHREWVQSVMLTEECCTIILRWPGPGDEPCGEKTIRFYGEAAWAAWSNWLNRKDGEEPSVLLPADIVDKLRARST